MSNNLNNDNDKEQSLSNEKTTNSKQRGYKIITFVVFLAICFSIIYITVDTVTGVKFTAEDDDIAKVVYSNTNNVADGTLIFLYNNGIIEKQQTLSEFKIENEIGIDISEQFLVNFFKAKGYELKNLKSDEIMFEKELEERVYEPNKYYLGIKDEYFAIYKADDKGELLLEEVLTDYKNIHVLDSRPEILEEVKKANKYYETKEELYDIVTAYTT